MKETLLLIIVLTLSCFCSYGQITFETNNGKTIDLNLVSQLIESCMDDLHMAGLSFGLIDGGELAYTKSFGYQNWDRQNPIEEDNIFEAASMSKPVFAWLVMKLIEKGIMDLDTPLYTYYEYPDISHDPNHQLITARLVLTHQTGLPNWRYGRPLQTDFSPGSDFSYSGEGFVYLGKTIEHLMKMSLEEIFQKEVFRPLGMINSTMVWSPKMSIRKTTGHYNGNVTSKDYYKPLEANPAASLHTTVTDFARFMMYILDGKGLSQDSYKEMLSIQVTPKRGNSHQNEMGTINWGLGWVIERIPHGLVYQHGGNNGDFESYFEISPDKKWGYVYFSNTDQGDELNKILNPFLRSGKVDYGESVKLEKEYEIPLDTDHWQIKGQYEKMEYQEEHSLVFLDGGEALLRDATYRNVVIEFDVAFPDDYCNVGLRFRGQDENNYENFYLRAHESGTNQSMQYTPVFNGYSGWQLYAGYNYNGRTTYFRKNDWIHVRMAVFDDWMEVYIDDMENLALHVFDLKHNIADGYISMWTDNTAYFSNFRIKEVESYDFYYDRQPKPTPPHGTITNWDLSAPFSPQKITAEFVDSLLYEKVNCEYNGLVNIAKYTPSINGENTILARVKLVADQILRKSIQFGYSDIGKIYLNGEIVYDGQNMFQSRDDDFRGTIGYFERIYLELLEGENSLWFEVTENFGGWGLMAKFDEIGSVKIESYTK